MGLLDRHAELLGAYRDVRTTGADPFQIRMDRILSPTEAIINLDTHLIESGAPLDPHGYACGQMVLSELGCQTMIFNYTESVAAIQVAAVATCLNPTQNPTSLGYNMKSRLCHSLVSKCYTSVNLYNDVKRHLFNSAIAIQRGRKAMYFMDTFRGRLRLFNCE